MSRQSCSCSCTPTEGETTTSVPEESRASVALYPSRSRVAEIHKSSLCAVSPSMHFSRADSRIDDPLSNRLTCVRMSWSYMLRTWGILLRETIERLRRCEAQWKYMRSMSSTHLEYWFGEPEGLMVTEYYSECASVICANLHVSENTSVRWANIWSWRRLIS